MAFDAIAFAGSEHSLLTIDGPALLAYDAHTEAPKWSLTFADPLVGVLYADRTALPGCRGSSPFRTAATTRMALVVDIAGRMHAVDTGVGELLGEIPSQGKPLAAASSASTACVALAIADAVVVWRNGERTEVPFRATVLAFSNDGATLAIANERGELRTLNVAAPGEKLEETFRGNLGAAVSDLAQHPSGAWVAAVPQGALAITAAGTSRVAKIPAGASRVRFDEAGRHLAVQLAANRVAVFAWPDLEVVMRIEFADRPVRGISFGAEPWLGVALDHGDGNKIDIVTSATHRTDTHPGRTHRSWTLLVEGQRERLSAKEADEIRRMQSSYVENAPSAGFGKGGRIGIGLALTLTLLGFRVCLRASSSSSSFNDYHVPSVPTRACDKACAIERLQRLRTECALQGLECQADVTLAMTALSAGNCEGAKTALERVGAVPTADGRTAMFGASRVLAKFGVDEACASDKIVPVRLPRAELVRLEGAARKATIEAVPDDNADEGAIPDALWAAADGTIFVATLTSSRDRATVYRRKSTGMWDSVYTKSKSVSAHVAVFGKSSSDVYVLSDGALAHFDGSTTTDVTSPCGSVFEATLAGGDLFVGNSARNVFRSAGARQNNWSLEALPKDLMLEQLMSGAAAVWAVTRDSSPVNTAIRDSSSDNVVARRAPNGQWAIKAIPAPSGSATTVHTMWISPTGEAFVAADNAIHRSSNGASSWTKYDMEEPVDTLWGRSSADVYAASSDGLFHYDGKAWSPTSYMDGVAVLGGTSKELLILRAR